MEADTRQQPADADVASVLWAWATAACVGATEIDVIVRRGDRVVKTVVLDTPPTPGGSDATASEPSPVR